MALHKKADTRADVPTQHDTTDVEDIQLLSDAIVAIVQTSSYDDMTWAEIDLAMMRASHALKLNFTATGGVYPPPPPEPPPEDPPARRG